VKRGRSELEPSSAPSRAETGRAEADWPASAAERTDLEKSEERFRVALAHSGVVAFEHDRDLRYTWIYPTQFYAVEQVLGRTDAELFDGDDARPLMELKRRVLKTGVSAREEVHVTKNGRLHEFVLTVVPLVDSQGTVVGLTGASTNIDAAKEVQRELAKALEFRDRVIGILGHDLRNPLSAIQGWTGRLLAREPLEDRRRPLLRIEQSVRRMTELIGTLLDFSDARFNASLPMSPAPTDLIEVMRGVIDELRAANPGRDIDLVVEGDAGGTWDGARLAQVASNLIANALTHGDEEGTVGVKIRSEGAAVVLEVSNGGSPIPQPRMSQLFKPFQPGHALATPPGAEGSRTTRRGLGLGLFIADQIVRAHAGSIEVASSSETGTVFSVRLPRAPSAEAPGPLGEPAAATDPTQPRGPV
jgi:PAS domain S-box-containing protein